MGNAQRWFALVLLFFVPPPQVAPYLDEGVWVQCEVLEVSPHRSEEGVGEAKLHFVVLRHRRPEDRPSLSAWLRARSGRGVRFKDPSGHLRRGFLYRLNRCFGRGLLFYTEGDLVKGSIIEVDLAGERAQKGYSHLKAARRGQPAVPAASHGRGA